MTTLNQLIEAQLISGLRRIDAPYRQALTILNDQPEAESKSQAAHHLQMAERLKPSMQLIATCEEELLPLRQQWRELEQTPGPELQELLASQTDLLKRLIEKLNEAELHMATSYSTIGNRLDSSRTHVAMRQAYQQDSV